MASKTITYNADTTQFVRNMEQTRQSLLATGDASDRAKAKILENSQQQIEAALKLGKSQETLDRITQQTAASMAAVTEKNAARIENAVERRIVKYRAEAAELEKLGRIQVEGGGHGFSDRQAVSAVVRGGEGNPGIRSMENALTMIPGFAAAAQTLAPIIGFAGLTGLFVELGVKGYEAFEGLIHGAEKTRDAFGELHDKQAVSIDDLEIQNQKLQDQIDKLGGHPNNGVATALLEAKKMADELLLSLEADEKQLVELFRSQDIGTFGKALSALGFGPNTTDTQEKQITDDFKNLEKKIRGIDTDFNKAMSGASNQAERDKAVQDRAKQTHDAYQYLIDSYSKESDRLGNVVDEIVTKNGVIHKKEDNSQGIANLSGALDILNNQQSKNDLTSSVYQRQTKVGGMKQGNEAEEAARKAAEKQMKAIDSANAEMKAKDASDHDQLLIDELGFWAKWAKAPELAAGNRTQVLGKLVAAQEALDRAIDEAQKKNLEQQRKADQDKIQQAEKQHDLWELQGKRSADDEVTFWKMQLDSAEEGSESYLRFLKSYTQAVERARKEAADAQRRSDQGELNDGRNGGRLANAGLKLRESQGQVSPYDAAVQQANINTQLSDAEMAALQKQLADATASKNPEEMFRANEALQKASVDRQIQIQEDAARIVGLTWEGALKNSLNVWAEDAQNTAQQVVQITQQAINGLNKNLVDAMFGDKTNFAGMFKDIGKTIAGDGLKQIEGAGLKALGIQGKPDGTASNPLHVVMAGGLFGGSGSGFADAAKSSAAKFFSSKSDDDDSDDSGGSSFVGKTMGFFGSLFGGGKAVGGDVQPGVSYEVGEMGRERFVPKTAGTIIPTHMLGGGHTFNVDARGSNNPAETAAMVREGILSAIPHIARAANGINADKNARRPPSKAR